MNFALFLETVKLRCKPFEPADQLDHAKIGMITELGELGDLIKRAFVYGKPFDPVNLMEEVGDYLWYFVLFCDVRGVRMATLDAEYELRMRFLRGAHRADEKQALLALACLTARLCEQGLHSLHSDGETRDAVVGLLTMLLQKHSFTLSQCLETNDKKLEARTGKMFSAGDILARDTAAERVILEAGAKGSG